MPAPFAVRDQDRPGVDLGQWDENGNITIPGTLSAAGLTSPSPTPGTPGTVTFAGLIAAFIAVAAGDQILTAQVSGDTNPRFTIDSNGKLGWGSGAGATDITINRYAAGGLEVSGALRFTNGQLLFRADGSVAVYSNAVNTLRTDGNMSVGGGLLVAEGSNKTMGRATLVGGTVVVSNTAVTANTEIFLTCNTPGGTPGFLRVSARTPATSFTILSSSGTDTSVVSWLMVEPTS